MVNRWQREKQTVIGVDMHVEIKYKQFMKTVPQMIIVVAVVTL